MRKLKEVESPYNRVEVWQNNAGRIDLEVSGATHATWHPSQLLTGHAWDAITAAVMSHPAPIESLLLLGLGGGTCLRQLRHLLPEVEMTAVEIDPEMISLAREYMEIDDLDVTVLETDAFEMLHSSTLQFDIVIDDLYHARGEDVERPKAVSTAYLQTVCRLLKSEGSLAMNFVVGPGHDEAYQQACESFERSFPQQCRLIPPQSHNEVLVGTANPEPLALHGDLIQLADRFGSEIDRNHWKELRSLKLR